MINDYLSLSTRSGFNKSLLHFRMVTGIVKRLGSGENLADIVDNLEKNKGVEKSQIGPILNAIVMDRLNYRSRSFNLPVDVEGFDEICNELQGWNRLDIVMAYHHPQLGINLLNPKDQGHWEAIRELNRDELMVLYIGALKEEDKGLEEPALAALQALLTGRKASDTAKFGGATPKTVAPPSPPVSAPAPTPRPPPVPVSAPTPAMPPPPPTRQQAPPPAAAVQTAPPSAPRGKMKMTPKYSVQVSNELFHNGNVEAWKNIVESYKTKFPGLEVHIFHDGQKVNNINSLFKWGKVKHGDVILFSVAGEEIQGVNKLKRYLAEGASIRFENYLKKDVNKVLNLF